MKYNEINKEFENIELTELEAFLLLKKQNPYLISAIGVLIAEIHLLREEFENHSHTKETVEKVVF